MDTNRELTAISTGRRHDLDALRAFAMYLGVFHHAAHSFVNPSWVIRDSQPIPWLGIFSSSGVHGFRMELFFLVRYNAKTFSSKVKQSNSLKLHTNCSVSFISKVEAT